MCGRYTLHTEKELLARRFALDLDGVEVPPRYNIAPTQRVPIARLEQGRRKAREMRWGLVPSWASTLRGRGMINARAETVCERPAFRAAVRRRRCLMLADGFYEWQAPALERGHKTPYWIALRSGEPFAFAAIWETWRAPDSSEPLLSCALLTLAANPDLEGIHARMPAILRPEAEEEWLDPARDNQPERILEALRTLPPGALAARPVSTAVNRPRNDGPELIAPYDPPETGFTAPGG